MALHSYQRYLDAGVNVALGTDTYPMDFIAEMRWAAMLTRIVERPGEGGVVALVRSRAYDAGAVSGYTLEVMREKGRLRESDLRIFWTSPGYSHCCFTAHRELQDTVAQQITEAFTAIRADDPEHREVLDLEG